MHMVQGVCGKMISEMNAEKWLEHLYHLKLHI